MAVVMEGVRLLLREAEHSEMQEFADVELEEENAPYLVADDLAENERLFADEDALHLIVAERATGRTVGYLLLAGLKSPHDELEWRHIIVTDKGRGYGKETMELLARWSFEVHGCHRAWLDCKDYNARALHVYEGCGMVREALLRDTLKVNGKYENLVILSMLEAEYRARYDG